MRRPQAKNFLSLATAEAVSKALTFLAFAYIARRLGTVGFGHVEWAAAVLMCASLIVDQGFSAYGAREIAKTPDKTAVLVSEIVTARIILALLAYVGLIVFASLCVGDPSIRNLLLLFGLSLPLLPFLLQWVFQGHDRMHLVSVTQVIRQLVFVSVVLLFVQSSRDIFVVGVAEIAAVAVSAAISVFLYWRFFGDHSNYRPRLSAETLKGAGTIGLSQLCWVVKLFGATVIVGLIATSEETGVFAGAMRIFIALHTFVWLYFFNLLPSLSRSWSNDPSEFVKVVRDSTRLVLLTAIPACVVGVISAPYLMTMAYGPDFGSGAGALRWLACACLAAAISGHFRFGLIAAGQQSLELRASAIGALTALVLIPTGYFVGGITFAALGLCIAESAILLASWIPARHLLQRRDDQVLNSSDYTVAAS